MKRVPGDGHLVYQLAKSWESYWYSKETKSNSSLSSTAVVSESEWTIVTQTTYTWVITLVTSIIYRKLVPDRFNC